jgi:hypothetical protein
MLANKLPPARQIPQTKVNFTTTSKESPILKDFSKQPPIVKPENTPQKQHGLTKL